MQRHGEEWGMTTWRSGMRRRMMIFFDFSISLTQKGPRRQRNFVGSSAPRTRCCIVDGVHERRRSFCGDGHNPLFFAIGSDPFPTPLRTSATFEICLPRFTLTYSWSLSLRQLYVGRISLPP